MSKLIAKLVLFALRVNLSVEAKSMIVGAFIENQVLPIRDIISWDNETGVLLIKGKPLEREVSIQLRESAKNAISSQARRLVLEQIVFDAIKEGIHKGTNPEQILFAKVAIWLQEKQEHLLKQLTQEE